MRIEKPAIAVVGASAAGLAATLAAARAGADVLLLESKQEIGVPAAPAIVGFDFLWPEAVPRPPQATRRRLDGARLRSSEGRGPRIDAPLTLFDRTRLDQHLAAEAEKSGARILTDVRGLTARSDRTLGAEGLEVRADIIIFADGAHTQATRFMRPMMDPENVYWGAVLAFEAPGDEETLILTLGSHAPGGRSQLNPLGNGQWSHWTFFRGSPERAEANARRALAIDARLEGWKDLDARFIGVAPDPVHTLPRELANGNILVAGGAAGQGGLEIGLASGWMAGEAAARREPRSYERAWRERYQRGYERLRRAADALAHLTDDETRALMRAWDGARLPPQPHARLLARHPRGALALAWAAWLAQARS